MSETKDPTKPQADAEKFRPQNVQDEPKSAPAPDERKGRDVPRGSESELQRKSGNRS